MAMRPAYSPEAPLLGCSDTASNPVISDSCAAKSCPPAPLNSQQNLVDDFAMCSMLSFTACMAMSTGPEGERKAPALRFGFAKDCMSGRFRQGALQ